VDHLLQSLNWEREYVHLHRDTTVQSLTLVSEVHAGVVSWRDSPLVKAVRFGRTLVVDEADKAPLEAIRMCLSLADSSIICVFGARK
jgi:von Willebrand factor A domain-containing protein 8